MLGSMADAEDVDQTQGRRRPVKDGCAALRHPDSWTWTCTRVAMAILRHADFSITMVIYSQASPAATREALRRLGERLDR